MVKVLPRRLIPHFSRFFPTIPINRPAYSVLALPFKSVLATSRFAGLPNRPSIAGAKSVGAGPTIAL